MTELVQTERLIEIMKQLRDKETGCPWDIEQTFKSIAPHTIEEAYEVADAIEKEDHQALCSELGDLLLQVVFHSQMAEEAGLFSFEEVAAAINQKLVKRHPHIFGEKKISTAEEQTTSWEAIKAEEREQEHGGQRPASALEGIPVTMPAMMRTLKIQKRAARVGFDWQDLDQVFTKLHEELDELKEELEQDGEKERVELEVGDLLFCVINIARHLHIDPERALSRCNAKFTRRFAYIEEKLWKENKKPEESTFQELGKLWDEVRHQDKQPSHPKG